MRLSILLIAMIMVISCASSKVVKHSTSNHIAVEFSENSGSSFHEAVIVRGATTQGEGIAAEYNYISKQHGKRGLDWFLIGQTIIHEENKIVDVIEISLKQSFDRKVFFFDASEFIAMN